MTEAVTRPEPRIDHPEELERMVRQIVARVDPVAIYLFGSRARGEGHADSDYDLMVVTPDGAKDIPGRRRDRLFDVHYKPEFEFQNGVRYANRLYNQIGREGLLLWSADTWAIASLRHDELLFDPKPFLHRADIALLCFADAKSEPERDQHISDAAKEVEYARATLLRKQADPSSVRRAVTAARYRSSVAFIALRQSIEEMTEDR